MRNLRRLVFLFGLLFTVNYSFGQNIDSLKSLLPNATVKEKSALLKKLSAVYFSINMDSSMHYSYKTIDWAKQNNLKDDIARAYYHRAVIINANNNPEDAIVFADSALTFYRTNKDLTGVTECTNLKGNIHQNKHEYDIAEEFYGQALKNALQLNDSLLIGICYQNLGLNNDYRGDFDVAIDYELKAIDLFEKIDAKKNLSQVYSNLGIVFFLNKEFSKALEYYDKSIGIKRGLNNLFGLCLTFDNKSATYLKMDSLNLATNALDSAVFYAKKAGLVKQQGILHIRKGTILSGNDSFDKAIKELSIGIKLAAEVSDDFTIANGKINLGEVLVKNGQPNKGIPYLKEGLKYAQSINSFDMESSALNNLTKAYSENTKPNQLVSYYKRLIAVNDSLFSKSKFQTMSELETKFETEKKESENQLLKQEKELQSATIQQQQTTLWASIAGIGLLASISFLLYRQSTERKKTNDTLEEQKGQIETLHKELAHRVKNNLAFVSALMSMQQDRLTNPEAKEAVKESELRLESMSLLHRKLHVGKQTTFNISDYLKELCANLQYSFPFNGNQPTITVDSDHMEMEGDPAMRLGLIINELVTNSFKYAFTNQNEPRINIALKKTREESYRITYQDNGKGIPADFDIKNSKSLGLKLIYTMTKQLNGTVEFSNNEGANFLFNFKHKKLTA